MYYLLRFVIKAIDGFFRGNKQNETWKTNPQQQKKPVQLPADDIDYVEVK